MKTTREQTLEPLRKYIERHDIEKINEMITKTRGLYYWGDVIVSCTVDAIRLIEENSTEDCTIWEAISILKENSKFPESRYTQWKHHDWFSYSILELERSKPYSPKIFKALSNQKENDDKEITLNEEL